MQTVRAKMDFKRPYSPLSCDCCRDGDKRHGFLSKVRLQFSSGSLKWTLTSPELTAKSPHHLLLSEVAREPNLWTLASSAPTGSSKGAETTVWNQSGRVTQTTKQLQQSTFRETWPAIITPITIEKLLFHQGWGEETEILQGLVQLLRKHLLTWRCSSEPGQHPSYRLKTTIAKVASSDHLKLLKQK